MPNLRIISDNAADRATLTASTTAGSLVVTNLQNDTKANVWRATSNTARLGATWNTTEMVSGVVMPYCNLSPTDTIRVRLSSEPAKTMLSAYTERLNQTSSWFVTRAIAIPNHLNAPKAPDGTYSVDKLVVDNTAATNHYIYKGDIGSFVIGDSVTLSTYAAAGELNEVYLQFPLLAPAFVANLGANFNLVTGVASLVSSGVTAKSTNVGNGIWRVSITAAATGNGAVRPLIYLASSSGTSTGRTTLSTADGVSGVYLWGAVLEAGELSSYYPSADAFVSRASTGTFIGSNGALQSLGSGTGSAFARYQHNPLDLSAPPTLLLEAVGTNLIRNNTMVGAVVAGAMPNNWAKGTTSGWTTTITAVSVVNGVEYIDFNVTGTATVVGATTIHFESGTGIAATVGEVVNSSIYVSLVSGSLAGVQTFGMGFIEYASDGVTSVTSSMFSGITPTSTLTRYNGTRTISAANAAYYRPNLRFTSTDTTTAVNFTIRIGLPQTEKNSFATSVIKTTSATVTRAADISTSIPGVRPAGYIDSWQSYNYDSGYVLASPATPIKLRNYSALAASTAYSFGGGSCATLWTTPVNAYGVAIDIIDTNNLSGYIEASRLVIGEYWSPVNNAEYNGAGITFPDRSEQFTTDAGDLKSDIGTRSKKISVNLAILPQADREAVVDIFRANGLSYPVFFSLFPANTDKKLERDFQIYGKLTSESTMSLPYFNNHSASIELESI